MRDQTVAMLRVKNEERFIGRCLASLWPVAQTVVVFDDGSTDETFIRALESVGIRDFNAVSYHERFWSSYSAPEGLRVLHYIHTPFGDVRPSERVNEFRDKELLWHYVKTNVLFDTVICLDGDEALSQDAIRHFDTARELLLHRDALELPVYYLWDSEKSRRIDGVYAGIRHPRIFTISYLTDEQLFNTRFVWSGSRAGFHIGSIPRDGFPEGLRTTLFPHPIVHYGYIDAALRQRKFEFYTQLDPGGQDGYDHIIGRPNRQAPGPIKLRPWVDS